MEAAQYEYVFWGVSGYGKGFIEFEGCLVRGGDVYGRYYSGMLKPDGDHLWGQVDLELPDDEVFLRRLRDEADGTTLPVPVRFRRVLQDGAEQSFDFPWGRVNATFWRIGRPAPIVVDRHFLKHGSSDFRSMLGWRH